ncbi:MAG: leucine-rich repeat domain-containing protein, partial [Clostridia bacterium]
NGVQTPYLLTWYMDEACTTPAEYNYTPISNQTLYGKTSKYPLFVPTNFVEYIDASTTVDSPGVIYKKLNATDVAVWGVNAGSLTEYSFPALIQIVGINYCVTQINGFNKVIKNLELPQGVDSIGSGAFKNNGELLEVIFPQSLLKIEAEAFRACYKLTSVIFPTNLTKIGNYAFMGPRLTSLFIPKSVTIFEQNPFLTNNNLQITIEPGSRFVMEKNCLIDTINKELVLGINATEIPNNMGIEKINVYALYYCKTLITVNIPSTVKIIDTYAFQACYKLQSVIIPASVNKMGYLVFDSCSVLKNVTINSIIPPSSRQYNFDKCHADLKIYVPPNSVGTTSSTPKEEYYKSATNWTTYANKIVAIGS